MKGNTGIRGVVGPASGREGSQLLISATARCRASAIAEATGLHALDAEVAQLPEHVKK